MVLSAARSGMKGSELIKSLRMQKGKKREREGGSMERDLVWGRLKGGGLRGGGSRL